MSVMVARRLWNRQPQARHLRALRTQAWPDGSEEVDESTKPVSRYKGKYIREIIRYKESEFDATAAKQQQVRLVTQLRELVLYRPGGLIDVSELTARHPSLAEIALEYPKIFNVLDYGTRSRLLCLTPEAQSLVQQEKCLQEERSVHVVRKLLMLSGEKRLPLQWLGLLAIDLGLPNDLRDVMRRHGEFFRVSTTLDNTDWVRLGSWDPALAVSFAAIEDRRRQAGAMSLMEMWTPKGYALSKRHRKVLARFRETPFVSPYSDYRDLEPLKIMFEKHAVAGMQELLSLTLHKSLVLNMLSGFKAGFSFSKRPLDLLLRHPEYFYVSSVGKQETVFLRSAYSNGELVNRSPLTSIREQFAKLLDSRCKDFV